MALGEAVKNMQIILKNYVTGSPKETDFEMVPSSLKLKVPEGSRGVLVKNLYLSCDPYLRFSMSKPKTPSYSSDSKPGSFLA
ncbi:hypothetical protein AMTR_s00013p00130980 [Amborella trichopoda]|uniref:Oxidoreductase N-terminal domain-containing protein n=1 Tax=Amborella trichopoda TaxID=13333 RepID=W1PRK4_AMBTC|nr:hypothetical protein AMTR_s00013p00130980 [Amborella trichopoda]